MSTAAPVSPQDSPAAPTDAPTPGDSDPVGPVDPGGFQPADPNVTPDFSTNELKAQVKAQENLQSQVPEHMTLSPLVAQNAASGFDPGFIISDELFYDGNAANADSVQNFLNAMLSSCRAGYVCLKDYSTMTTSRPASAMCNAYNGGGVESAATIIYKVGVACGISQKAMLVLLQKEQSLITDSWPSARQYAAATGYACPDTADCDANYAGFYNQVYWAAYQFKRYGNPPGTSNFFTWYPVGGNSAIRFSPNAACGSSNVVVRNKATAALYYYTPYQPNQAAINGNPDTCSAFGNLNFYTLYKNWFGPVPMGPPVAPVGAYEKATATGGTLALSGWAADASSLSTSNQVKIDVYLPNGSNTVATVTASVPRPELNVAVPGLGVNHGYSWSMPITQKGKYVTCVTSMPLPGNPAPGTVLGCTTQTYTPVSIAPIGTYEKATATNGTLSLSGWAADATSLSSSNQVKIDVYLPNGTNTTISTIASVPRPELNVAVPGLGVNHGYSWSMPITTKGKYITCVTSMPLAGNAAPGTVLGCTTQTYTPVAIAPVGAYEKATATGGTLALSGWAADASSLSTSNQVKIDVYLPNGSNTVATVTASVPRPELNVAVPGLGVNHGYSWSMPITQKGKYVTCVTSMPLPGNPAPGTVLGCTTQTYTPVSIAPIGTYEKATATNGTLSLSGWAADATSLSSSNQVKIDVYLPNGTNTTISTIASVPRPELNVAVPGLGVNHGYSWSMPITTKGKYITCVTSMPLAGNAAPGTVLGCTTQTY
ncbi:hypothetical protein C5E11_15970 [Clavibacter michiganensis]|nr:hypothetical protein C5E11_15970 [Clavibacter michiganensis]